MTNLPDERIGLYQPAFSYTGIDFFAPLFVKHSKHTRITQTRFECYGAVFVCLTTRAVHFDLVGDLSRGSFFLIALISFMAKRGKLKTTWADNDTNFIGAEKDLSKLLNDLNQTKIENSLINKGVTWKRNPPSSSWMGGSWEYIAKLTKRSLKSILKDSLVYEESLRIFLIDAEFTLNSRSLLPLSDDIIILDALTPNHFLIRTLPLYFNPNIKYKKIGSRIRWKGVDALSKTLWDRFVKEYLPSLQI